jgi:hypothetical protein
MSVKEKEGHPVTGARPDVRVQVFAVVVWDDCSSPRRLGLSSQVGVACLV